jgi:hypothetical protein
MARNSRSSERAVVAAPAQADLLIPPATAIRMCLPPDRFLMTISVMLHIADAKAMWRLLCPLG